MPVEKRALSDFTHQRGRHLRHGFNVADSVARRVRRRRFVSRRVRDAGLMVARAPRQKPPAPALVPQKMMVRGSRARLKDLADLGADIRGAIGATSFSTRITRPLVVVVGSRARRTTCRRPGSPGWAEGALPSTGRRGRSVISTSGDGEVADLTCSSTDGAYDITMPPHPLMSSMRRSRRPGRLTDNEYSEARPGLLLLEMNDPER